MNIFEDPPFTSINRMLEWIWRITISLSILRIVMEFC